MKKIITVVLIALVIAAGVFYIIWSSGNYVASVGGQKIKNHEYIFFLRAQKQATETEADVTDIQGKKKLWETPVDGEDPISIVMNQALENTKEFKVQLIKAEHEKFKLSDTERKDINQYLNSWLENIGNKNYVVNDLGISISQFKDMMIKSELVNRFAYSFIQKNRDAVSVSDEEAKEYYDTNRDSFDDVTVRHILISTNSGMTKEQKEEKRNLSEGLFERIMNGEDMSELVEEYSEDSSSKESGGTYTFTINEPYAGELKDWAFNAEIGDLDIIETQLGYHVIRLEEKNTFNDKKELVRSTIKAQKLNEYYQNQVEEWMKDPDFNLVKNEDVLNKVTKQIFE